MEKIKMQAFLALKQVKTYETYNSLHVDFVCIHEIYTVQYI